MTIDLTLDSTDTMKGKGVKSTRKQDQMLFLFENKIQVFSSDIDRLNPGCWLNDKIIEIGIHSNVRSKPCPSITTLDALFSKYHKFINGTPPGEKLFANDIQIISITANIADTHWNLVIAFLDKIDKVMYLVCLDSKYDLKMDRYNI